MTAAFAGKSVLITGGGTGVGADMARAFAAAGARVMIGGRREAPLRAVADGHERIDWTSCDVTQPADVKALFDAAGEVDIAIANAGQADSNPLVRVEPEEWARLIGVNLTGVYHTYREAALRMETGGRIISVASMAGLTGLAYAAPYTAAKHGVVGLTRALALELAPREITVNAICPGYLDTELTDGSVAKISAKTGMSEDAARAVLADHNPMKRLIRADEVTSAALWLASPGASSVNGQAIAITGGG